MAFYSGSIADDKYILDYFRLKPNVLIDEMIKEKHFYYPTLNNENITPEFVEDDVEIMREELIIRQHFNELFDCVLCGLKIRQNVKGSKQYIWNDFDKLKFDNEEKELIKQMKNSIELIYPKWKIYIEVLDKVISQFGSSSGGSTNKFKIFDTEIKPKTSTTTTSAKKEEPIVKKEENTSNTSNTSNTGKAESKDYPVVTASYISDDKEDSEAEFKKMIQPVRKSTIHYEDNIHPTLKFYSCHSNNDGKDNESLNIQKYFEVNGEELLDKINQKIEIIFPFVNEGNPVFLASDKDKLTDDIIMRQNYNKLVDNVLVEMGIRGKRKSSQLKWSKEDLSNMSEKMLIILRRMRKSIEDIFPSWIIYLNVLNKLLEN